MSVLPPIRAARGAFALLATLLLLSVAAPTRAQFARPGELPELDDGIRSAILDSLTAVIDSVYVFEEPARNIVSGLRENLAAGTYDEIVDPVVYAQRLFEDAQAIHHDGHFQIAALPPLPDDVRARQESEDPEVREREERLRRARNHGFQKAEILPGGIGYVRFDAFGHGTEAYEAAAAAMNFVSNARAVIFDVRNNGGGSAAMIRFLCGYLFEERTHLINWDVRAENRIEQSHSLDQVPGRRFPDTPVYVLVSGRTFSAAEEFSFDLKNLERATLVGETTGGGGNTVAGYVFEFDGFRMLIRVPYGHAYFPPTGEGWEGVGVTPHVEVPADEALDTAHELALEGLIAEEEDEVVRGVLDWARLDVKSRREPVQLPLSTLRDLAGQYGPRAITLEDGVLFYRRDDGPIMALRPLDANLFAVGDLDYFRISFDRGDDGRIVGIVGHYDDGRTDGHPRDDG